MTYTFIKKPELIEENYQVDDLLDFSTIIDKFKKRIYSINKNSIVGLKGPYGSGKSTMLYQIYKDNININNEKEIKQLTERWFVFDAWQYPERKDLWEGFVLDMARQYDKELFNQIRNKIDGTTARSIKILGKAAIDAISIKCPPVSFFKNFINLFQTSPIKRVYDIQDLLLDIINKIDKDIFIVIEDIDRSGDMGVYFLETLKHFIKNQEEKLKHKIIIIVPVGEEIWGKDGDKKIQDSYLKILDLTVQFNPADINLSHFIKEIIDINYLSELMDRLLKAGKTENNILDNIEPEIIIYHLRHLFESMILKEKQTTIRDIKNILRKSESNFSSLEKPHQQFVDIRILILFTAIEYFYQKEKYDKYIFILQDGQYKGIKYISNDFWGIELFFNIINANINIGKNTPTTTHKIYIDNKKYWLPEAHYGDEGINCHINSNYFSAAGVEPITR